MATLHPSLDPNRGDDLREFEVGLAALYFGDAAAKVRALISPLSRDPKWHLGIPADFIAAVHRSAEESFELCDRFVRHHNKLYSKIAALRREDNLAWQKQQAFLVDFTNRQVYTGADETPHYSSFLGWIDDNPGEPLSLSRDSGRVVLVAGAQGGGKTVLSTIIGESSQQAEPPITSAEILPTAFAFFHIEEQDRLPQLLDGLKKNPKRADLEMLKARLGIGGLGIERIRLAVPITLLPELEPRLRYYEDLGLQVIPLKVHLSELGQPGLEGALGAGSDARYVQRMLDEAQDQGKELTVAGMRYFIDNAKDLDSRMKGAAHTRLNWLGDIASPLDGPGIWDMYEPGWATVGYLGGPYVGQRRVLPVLVGMLHGLMMPSKIHGAFQRIITVDEMNLLEKLDAAWTAFTRVGRLVRHLGSMLILMGQDLKCVDDELFGLAELVFVFLLRNPKIWEHIRDRVGSLQGRKWNDVAILKAAECILGMSRSTVPAYRNNSVKLKIRPPRCEHGGYTRAMV